MKKKNFTLVFALAVVLLPSAYTANILFFHQIASFSHQVATYPLAQELSKRGHQITYITPWHHKGTPLNPNLTLIVPEQMRKSIDEFAEYDFDINHRVEKKFPRLVYQFYPMAITTCEQLLSSEELAEFVSKTPKLDLMIMDNCMSECGLAIAYKYSAKHIFFTTVNQLGNEYDLFGFNPESSAIPELEINPPNPPFTFWERVVNTLIPIHFRWVHYSYEQEIDKLVRKYLQDPEMPFIDDLARNASLMLYSGDIITEMPRSHPPFVVNVGGMMCSSVKKKPELPEDIRHFIEGDASSDGFIYISFGSVAEPSKLPKAIQQVLFDTMEMFPKLKFLFKWRGPEPDSIPKNVYLSSWFPQLDVLGHKKIKGFITQSGRPSTMESLCNAVPMLSFPVLGDQDINANRMSSLGASIKMEFATVTRDQLHDAIQQMAYGSRMKQRMIELQNILNDQQVPAIEKAVWWVEYVLRHPETSHLRAAGFEQNWFQRRLLDVYAFLFSIILGILAFIFWVLKACFKSLQPKRSSLAGGVTGNKRVKRE